MSRYFPRIVDAELERSLRIAGGVHVRGPRACGKTATARQQAASMARLDLDTPEAALGQLNVAGLLAGDTPRLLDEWQAIPEVWNAVRHEIDDRGERGQFILTGSSTPNDDAVRHPGAGRIVSLTMRTMTLSERAAAGYLPGSEGTTKASLGALLGGQLETSAGTTATVSDYANWIVGGGWPGFIDLASQDAQYQLDSYLQEVAERDYPQISGPRRNPLRLLSFLRAYAGVVGQPASMAGIRKRIGEQVGTQPGEELVSDLHEFSQRLFMIEDQPAWSTSLRSKTALVTTPKRHLADPSLMAALLGAGPERLVGDLETFGFAFESQVVHDLRVYAQANRVRGVFHMRDTKGRDEIDVIVEGSDGRWAGFEVKLSHAQVERAADNLLRIAAKVTTPPTALVVVIPTGPVTRL
ncbi:MAG: ATP-binding protein, partial [Buchananella hordeovulneris]|nr:ATP-binding protein [Buchananella hordeovulneris]